MSAATRLSAGLAIAGTAMLLTHPLAVAAALVLALAYAHRVGVHRRTAWVHRAAFGIGIAVLAFNALFSWNGATLLWRAPFRVSLLGRPRITVEAIGWGATAGAQLAATVIALGAATFSTPPEALHRGLSRAGVPESFATAAGLALRLVPDTAEDARAMDDALAARGVPTGGVRGKSQVLVPLTARSLDRAMEAEEALLLRGYGSDARRQRRGLPRVAWAGLGAVAVAALVGLLGAGRPGFYPTVEVAWTAPVLVQLAAALTVPALLTWRVDAC